LSGPSGRIFPFDIGALYAAYSESARLAGTRVAADMVIGMVAPVPVMRVNRRRFAGRISGRMDAEGAIDTPNNAANHPANQPPNRSCGLAAYGRAMSDAVGNALRLCGQRASERRNDKSCEHDTKFHASSLSFSVTTPPRRPKIKAIARRDRGRADYQVSEAKRSH
jgi:hypothetical protein